MRLTALPISSGKNMRILLIKTSALGDVVHLFPVATYLRHHLPEAQIDWLVERPSADLVSRHPGVDRAIALERRSWPSRWAAIRELRRTDYDLLIDFQANCKSALFTLFAKAKRKVGFGGWAVAEWPSRLATRERFTPPRGENIRSDYLALAAFAIDRPFDSSFASRPIELEAVDREEVEELLRKVGEGRRIAVCPGSAWKNKRLTEAQLLALLQKIDQQQNSHFLLIWGSEEERQLNERLATHLPGRSSLVPKLSLAGLQNLMGRVDLVVSMDSLPLHLCGTTKTASFSVYGPSRAAKYCPPGSHHLALQGSCPYGRRFEKRCPILRSCPTGACIHQLTGDELFQSLLSIQPPPKTASPS